MKKAFAVSFLLMLASGGCVTKTETLESPHAVVPADTEDKTVVDKRVVYDPALLPLIEVVRLKSFTGTDGFLKLQINVKNLRNQVQKFSYRIDWFEANGILLPLASSIPQPWTLLRRETSFLAVTAPTHSAKDFRITFLGPGK